MKKWILGIVFLLMSVPVLFAADFDQFKSVFTISDLFNRRVVESELRKNIWYVNPDKRNLSEPTVEFFHETELVGNTNRLLANLQFGAVWTVYKNYGVYGEWNFFPSELTVYSLFNMNYISIPGSAAYQMPVFYLLTPYFFNSREFVMDSLHGVLIKFGYDADPILQISAGLTWNARSTNLSGVNNSWYFNIESPRYNGFMTFLFNRNDVVPTNAIIDLMDIGYNYDDAVKDRSGFRWMKNIKTSLQFDFLNNRQALLLDANLLLGFIDFKTKLNFAGFLPTSPQYVRGGFSFFFSGEDAFSSVYQSAVALKLYTSYYFKENDIYFNGLNLKSPWGYLGEFSWQAPALMTWDIIVLCFDFNMWVLGAVSSGMSGDPKAEQGTRKDFTDQWERIEKRLANNTYQSDVFSRMVIGFAYNDSDTLEKLTFAADQMRVYVKLNVFF